MGRTVVAVIVGYVIFGLSAVVLFKGTGHSPGVIPTTAFAAVSVGVGLLSAIAAGWTTARLAPQSGTSHAVILAILMIFSGLVSFFFAPGVWFQLLTMFVFAPAAMAGGMMGQGRRGIGNR
jgi:hypothetical protein